MQIFADKKAGRLYDLFSSIFVACNAEYYYNEIEKINIPVNQEFKTLVDEVISLLGDEIEDYRMFFTVSNIAYSLIDFEKIWELKELDKYLKYVKSKDNFEIQKTILSFISVGEENLLLSMNDDKFKQIISDNNKLFKFLNDKPIPHDEKWNILSIINDIDMFKSTFISLIKKYSLKYNTFIKKYEKDINKFFDFLISEVNEKGLDIDEKIKQLVDLNAVDTIYIIPSYFHAYTISQRILKSKGISYMFIGKYVDEILQESKRESSAQKYVSVFKNLGDLNRYKFIKIISQGEKYGQEIADELDITSATVSYHANNLFVANLLRMERIENKTYYSLNKETLREMIDFIQKDLKL